jgi:hypothetical protein
MIARIAFALWFSLAMAIAGLPPKPTDYAGTVVAANEQAITVQGKIGTRVFPIYPGTVFGKGGRQKLADFKPGTPVIVVFSEITGIVRAENIRTAEAPKPKNAKPGAKPGQKAGQKR